MRKIYSLLLLGAFMLLGAQSAWGWYVPNNIEGNTSWSVTDYNMGSDNTITFYNVASGTYKFQLTDGSNWSGNSCIESCTGATNGTDGSDATIYIDAAKDITITVTNESQWKVSVVAVTPNNYIKYPWNGGDWAWSGALVANGDGTYSCSGQYGGTSFNHTRTGHSDNPYSTGTSGIATTLGTYSTGDECIFTYDPSNNSLVIRKCNSIAKVNHFYFDNTDANWNDEFIYFVIGRPEYSRVYRLENIPGTSWYYGNNSNEDWTDAGYYALIGSGSAWDATGTYGQGNIKTANHYSAAYVTSLDFAAEDVVVIRKANNVNGGAIAITKNEFVHKTITSAGWATYCSPHALDFSSSIANLTAAYIVTGGTNGVLAKTQITETVPANTGLLLKGNGVCFIPIAASSDDVDGNILTGVTADTPIAAEAGWVLMSDGSHGLGFYQNKYAFTVGANTAYIPIAQLPVPPTPNSDAPARFMLEDEANNATDIKSIDANEDVVKFVEKGQLLIMKNGVVYDVTGRVIR